MGVRKKISDLTAATAVTTDDLFVLVDAPATTPLTKKITWSAIVDYFATSTNVLTLTNEGLHILDTNASHDLIIKPGSDLSADRILTITTGDAARTVTLSGNLTVSGNTTVNDWFDQSVKAAATPQFARVGLGAAADATSVLTTAANPHIRFPSTGTAFGMHVSNVDFSGVRDDIFGIGYNIGDIATNTPINGSEPMFFNKFEANYYTGAYYLSEYVWDWVSADRLTTRRPIGISINRTTPYEVWSGLAATYVLFSDVSNTEKARIDSTNGRLGMQCTPRYYEVELGGATGIGMRSTGVAHGITNVTYTDIYASIEPSAAAAGGLLVRTFTDNDSTALILQAVIGVTDPTDTTPAIIVRANKKSGTNNIGALDAAETCVQWRNHTTALMTLLGAANLIVGAGTAAGTSATNTLVVGTGATAPASSPADAFQMYSADITAGNAAPHFRTEGGTVVKLYQSGTMTQTYSTADATLSAYTADVENVAYTGAADSEAKLTDLNALRVAYENLRAFTEDLAAYTNALVDALQLNGLIG